MLPIHEAERGAWTRLISAFGDDDFVAANPVPGPGDSRLPHGPEHAVMRRDLAEGIECAGRRPADVHRLRRRTAD